MADPAAAKLGRSNLLMEAMETLIDESAQIGVAKQYGMQISTDELEKAIEKTAQRNQLNIEQLQQRLQEQGLSWEQYRTQVRRQMLLQASNTSSWPSARPIKGTTSTANIAL